MPRRKPWNGMAPASTAEARRLLLDAASDCINRLGLAKAGLSDVAQAAGVTRQTVYRYFESTDDLFHSAAALSSGGLHERMRAAAMVRPTLAERIVECVVFCIQEIPRDPHLLGLTSLDEHLTVSAVLRLSFVQEEMAFLMEAGQEKLPSRDLDELAELLLRLLRSFLRDPGELRDEAALRAFLVRWLVPAIEARTFELEPPS